MKDKKLVSLAYGTASKKAIEGLYPQEQRLFEDEYSLPILPLGLRFTTNMFKNKTMPLILVLASIMALGSFALIQAVAVERPEAEP